MLRCGASHTWSALLNVDKVKTIHTQPGSINIVSGGGQQNRCPPKQKPEHLGGDRASLQLSKPLAGRSPKRA